VIFYPPSGIFLGTKIFFPAANEWVVMKLHNLLSPIPLDRPFWQLAEIFAKQPCGFLLDSGMDPQKLGRHSFLGARPTALLTAKRLPPESPAMTSGRLFQISLVRWRNSVGEPQANAEAESSQWPGDPFEALRQLQQEYGMMSNRVAKHPFTGGLVGFLGYEAGHAIECLPDQGLDESGLPDLAFMVADEVLVHDHLSKETSLLVTGRGHTQEDALKDAQLRTRELNAMLAEYPFPAGASIPERITAGSPPPEFRAHFTRRNYMQAVEQCRQHILAGDVFEVCLTQQMERDLPVEPWQLYKRLRNINPAPFASWLHFPGFQVVSASPERFLKLDHQGKAESRPIKGTRPRGHNPGEDQRLHDDLLSSEKDRAENVMIVDLVRNDIGRVAEIGSVEVPELCVVEAYATVFQLVSTVTGQLRTELDAFDLVRSCFPGGSMSGAPKIEAMKIIDGIEPVKRGIYSGAIGYFDRGGAMDLSIVIRTIVCKDGKASFGVGGAVVVDSDPAAEYQETLDKAAALIRALGGES
jgi:para-aminobenzoate synthetase component I